MSADLTVQAGGKTCAFGYADDPCGAAADFELIAMCVHEHCLSALICSGCAPFLGEGSWCCTPCRDGREPHADCRVTPRLVPLGDAP